MVKHVVIWKLKELRDGIKLKADIEALSGKIPGLLSIEAGVDINRSEAAGDLILISTHDDLDALKLYQDHPIHLELKAKIVPCVTGRTVVDYNI